MRRRPFSNTRRRNATGALVLALAVGPGCSFLFTDGPPARHGERASFQCGESHAPPIVDTIAAGAFALAAVGTARGEDQAISEADPVDRPQVRRDTNVAVGVFAAATVLDVASAVYGYATSAACREAQEERRADLARARLLPPPYGTPPYGEPPPAWPPPVATAAPVTPSR